MSLAKTLNRPGPAGDAWRVFYDHGYDCLKSVVKLAFRPMFGVRRVGPYPDVPKRGVIFCANHASYLDPAFVQLVIPRRVTFVMTNDFYRQPWGRWFFALVGAIPVGGARLSRAGIKRTIAHVKRGHSVVLFPEGRLSRDGELHRGQRGVALVAQRTGAPIYPLGIAGSMRAWPWGAISPAPADVRIKFGDPLQWEGEPGRGRQQAFADEIMRRISSERTWLETNAPGRYPDRTNGRASGQRPGVQILERDGR